MSGEVIRTFPPIGGEGLWLDVVRDGPGQYSVHAINNPAGNPIMYGFILPERAEEWVVELQDQQRAQLQAEQQAQQVLTTALSGRMPWRV